MATSVARIGDGVAVFLVVEMVLQPLIGEPLVRRLGWLGVGLRGYTKE